MQVNYLPLSHQTGEPFFFRVFSGEPGVRYLMLMNLRGALKNSNNRWIYLLDWKGSGFPPLGFLWILLLFPLPYCSDVNSNSYSSEDSWLTGSSDSAKTSIEDQRRHTFFFSPSSFRSRWSDRSEPHRLIFLLSWGCPTFRSDRNKGISFLSRWLTLIPIPIPIVALFLMPYV